MKHWWQFDEDLFNKELAALKAAGLNPVVNCEEQKKAGRILIDIKFNDLESSKEYQLTINYPEEFPFFSPVVITDNSFPNGKHKNPNNNNLCLLHDVSDEWNRMVDTAASVIGKMLPLILTAHKDPESAVSIEANIGVQAHGYYRYEPASIIFTSKTTLPTDAKKGTLELALEQHGTNNEYLSGILTKVVSSKNEICYTGGDAACLRFLKTNPKTLSVKWIKLNKAPPYNINEAIRLIHKTYPSLRKNNPANNDFNLEITAICYPVETSYTEKEMAWLFIARRPSKTPDVKPSPHFIRSDLYDKETLLARAPKLAPLHEKKVALIGAGAIGSTVVTQLARAGVGHINIVDHDIVTTGNLMRWDGQLDAVGRGKAEYLAGKAMATSFFVKAEPFHCCIGSPSEPSLAHIFLKDVDMIIDTSASQSVSDYLSAMAKKIGVPYVWATGTPGSYGGVVGRILPDKETGCFMCYRYDEDDGTITMPVSDPDDKNNVQPVGCFDPTFTGTGFDMDQVSISCARMAIATLCRGHENGYSDFDWDIGVVNLWNPETQKPIAPSWKIYDSNINSNCKAHG